MEGSVLKVYGTFIALRKNPPSFFFAVVLGVFFCSVSRLIRDFGDALGSPRAAVLFVCVCVCVPASPGAGAAVVVVRVIRSARVERFCWAARNGARRHPPPPQTPPPTTITLFL